MTVDTLNTRYQAGRISIEMLKIYVRKGVITAEQYAAITGEEYVA